MFSLPREKSKLMLTIRRLHTNLGHPSKTVMARILRDAGAEKAVLDALESFECTIRAN